MWSQHFPVVDNSDDDQQRARQHGGSTSQNEENVSHNTSYDSANMPRTQNNSDSDFAPEQDQNRLIQMIYANYH